MTGPAVIEKAQRLCKDLASSGRMTCVVHETGLPLQLAQELCSEQMLVSEME
jgi:hypothetical protein